MPLYQYDSYNNQGKRIRGTIDASSTQNAKELLKGQGLMPISVKEIDKEVSTFSIAQLFEKKVDTRTKVLFTKQLSVLLKSGVPLLRAFELLIDQFEGEFKRILINLKDGIKEGKSLASQLNKYHKVFPNVYIQLVKAGEASGKLEVILNRLTNYLERTEETKKRVKKAMAYPIFMISFSILVIVGVLTFLIPKIKDMFLGMGGKELPGPTQMLMNMSDFFLNNILMISLIFLLIIIGFLYWKKTPKGKNI